ncbi:MAG: hypothetical protein IJ945_08440 [Oscillospiraceae bacterium]|nr:hypothetical protein [Oscillospiraceae bacterium]
MKDNDNNKKTWATQDDYEDFVFKKVMQIYYEKEGKEILKEMDDDNDKSDLDLDYINKLMDETK